MSNAEKSSRREVVGALAALLGGSVLITRSAAALSGGAPHHAEEVTGKLLFEKELAGHPGEQVSMTVVNYPPGLESQPHSHHGPVFVYVLEGTMELQVNGGPLTTVPAGETFYEPPVVCTSSRGTRAKPSRPN